MRAHVLKKEYKAEMRRRAAAGIGHDANGKQEKLGDGFMARMLQAGYKVGLFERKAK